MTPDSPTAQSGPSVCDTTIAEHVANAAHGSRYGIDWIWHDDRLGYLLTKPSKALPPAGARDAVTDEMVERAEVAIANYWKDPGLFVKCGDCKGTGKVPCGDSQDWCDCGGGMVNTGNDRDALRAALEAAITGKADGGDALAHMFPGLQSDLAKVTTGATLVPAEGETT